MKEFIIQNMEIIVSFITMIITWGFGYIIKKNQKYSNKLIPLQNVVIMLLAVGIYYWATGDFSSVIASGSPVATLIYDLIHTFMKAEHEEHEDAGVLDD